MLQRRQPGESLHGIPRAQQAAALQIQPQLIHAACTAKVTLESSEGWSSKPSQGEQAREAVPEKCHLEHAAANMGLMQAEGCCSFCS